MFRRHSAAQQGDPAPGKSAGAGQPAAGDDQAATGPQARRAATPGKGRPTPKRSESAPRRQPMTAPGNRKQAYRSSRERDRGERARRAEGLRRGDPRYFPARDQGPVRALARDYVDSRRSFSQYNLIAIGVLFALLLLRLSAIVDLLLLVTLIVIVGEGLITRSRVLKMAAERYPGQSTKGVALYAAMRSMQLRRLRVPPPRIKVGDRI